MRKFYILLALAAAALVAARLWLGGTTPDALNLPPDLNFLGDAFWKAEFLKNNPRPGMENFGSHDVHPTRGWVPMVNKPGPESANAHRMRGTIPYAPGDGRFAVMIVGDSFTWGSGQPDDETWPALMQALHPEFQVMNLAVGGYGLDQMYLTLREELPHYRVDLVLVGVIHDSINRALLGFREYWKPRFVLDAQGQLQLTNVPIPPVPEGLAQLRAEYLSEEGYRKLQAEDAALLARIGSRAYYDEFDALGEALVHACAETCRENEVPGALLHLAQGNELRGAYDRRVADNLQRWAEAAGLGYLRTHERFAEEDKGWVDYGHYHRAEAQFTAEIVGAFIRATPAYAAWAAAHPELAGKRSE